MGLLCSGGTSAPFIGSLADEDDTKAVLWAAAALSSLLPTPLLETLDRGPWSSNITSGAMRDAVTRAAAHFDSTVIVEAELSGSSQPMRRVAPQTVPAYAGPWGGPLVQDAREEGAEERGVVALSVSLAVIHLVQQRLARVGNLQRSLQAAADLVTPQ